jgi:hypothetical protein
MKNAICIKYPGGRTRIRVADMTSQVSSIHLPCHSVNKFVLIVSNLVPSQVLSTVPAQDNKCVREYIINTVCSHTGTGSGDYVVLPGPDSSFGPSAGNGAGSIGVRSSCII